MWHGIWMLEEVGKHRVVQVQAGFSQTLPICFGKKLRRFFFFFTSPLAVINAMSSKSL